MEKLDKLATLGTQITRRRQTKQTTQHNMYWTHNYTQASATNVNKTLTLLLTTGRKDESHIN